jgi:uncharacterized protein YuzE
MSKNITIQEGGIDRQFTASKLRTSEVGGGSVTWIPEDEASLTTKHISVNGTYNASDDEAYGYSTVYVNVPGGSGSANADGTPTIENGTEPGGIGSSVIGKDPETGNEIAVGVDEEGNIVQTEVPSAIKVLKAPDKTAYTDGETINYAGIVVHMKKKDGTDYTDTNHLTGLLLLEELTLSETTAHGGSGEGEAEPPSEWNFTNILVPVPYSRHAVCHWVGSKGPYVSCEVNADCAVAVAATGGAGVTIILASEKQQISYSGYYILRQNGARGEFNTTANGTAYTYDGKTVYYLTLGSDWGADENTVPTRFSTSPLAYWGSGVNKVAWTMVYGSGGGGGESKASIPVQWTSPYDGRTFEDSFEITVSPAPENDEGEQDTTADALQ